MRIAFSSLKGIGGTFMDWSFCFLTNCNQGMMYSPRSVEQGKGEWIPVTDDPINIKNAHKHLKIHPRWEHPRGNMVKNYLEEIDNLEGIITFYPYVDGSYQLDNTHKVNEEMLEYLVEQDVKVFLIKPTVPYPYFSERTDNTDPMLFLRRWLKDQLASVRKIRELASFRVEGNAKKYIAESQKYHSRVDPIVMATFTDVEWQDNPEDCMKTICNKLGMKILPERLEQWREIAEQWVKNNRKSLDWYNTELKKIITYIKDNKKLTFPKVDIIGQIAIMAHLMKDHNKRLILPTDDFPLDAQILHGFLK